MGWDVIRHSLQMLFRNFRHALRVSVGPTLLGLLAFFFIVTVLGIGLGEAMEAPNPEEMPPGVALAAIIGAVLFIFISAWVAVAWHRFILLEEYPGTLPALSGRPVWPYAGRSVQLGLLLLALLIPAFILVAVLAAALGGSPALEALLGLGAILYFSYMSLRLGLVLPATAIGRPMGFRQSWRETEPYATAILGTSVIIVLINGAVPQVSALLPNPLRGLIDLAAGWVTVMLGISVLTTLYGVIIERRDLT